VVRPPAPLKAARECPPAVADAIGNISGSVLMDLSDCDFIDATIISTLFDRSRSIETDGSILEIGACSRRECRSNARTRPRAPG
jgi:hypothetical protein